MSVFTTSVFNSSLFKSSVFNSSVFNRGTLNPSWSVSFLSSLPSAMTFTRASNAWRYNSSGNYELSSPNTARISYNPSTLAARGLLLEEERTNLVPYSDSILTQWFDNSSSRSNAGGTALGFFSRTAVASTGVGTWNRCRSGTFSMTSGLTYVVYWFFEAGTSGKFYGSLDTGGNESSVGGTIGSIAAIGTTVGTFSNVSETVISGNVRQVSATFVPGLTSAAFRIGFGPYTTTTGQTVIALGAQVELANSPSSYISTGASAVTRAQDFLSLDNLGLINFNANEGTYVIEVEFDTLPPASRFAILGGFFIAGTSSNTSQINTLHRHTNGNIRAADFVGSSNIYSTLGDVPKTTGIVKMAHAFRKNDLHFFAVDGTSYTSISADIPGSLVRMLFARDAANVDTFRHPRFWLRRISYYNTRLTASQCAGLTV